MRIAKHAPHRLFALLLAGLILPAALAFGAKSKTPKVDVNTATQEQLETLPGVGEAYAKKIIAGRPYSSVADLSKAGLPASTIDKITPLATASKPKKEKAAKAAEPAGEDREGREVLDREHEGFGRRCRPAAAPAAAGAPGPGPRDPFHRVQVRAGLRRRRATGPGQGDGVGQHRPPRSTTTKGTSGTARRRKAST